MAVNRVLLVFFASLACCSLAAEDGPPGRRAGDVSASPGGRAFGGEAPSRQGKTSGGSVLRMRGEGQAWTTLWDPPLRGAPLFLSTPEFLPPTADSPPPPPYPFPFPVADSPPPPPYPFPFPVADSPPPPPYPVPFPGADSPPPPPYPFPFPVVWPPPPSPAPAPAPEAPYPFDIPPPPPPPSPPPPSPSPPPPSPPPPSPSPPPPHPPPPPSPPPPEPRPYPFPPPPTPSPSPTPAPDASILVNLSVSDGGKLVPGFSPLVFKYKVWFGSNVKTFRVTAYVPQEEEDYRHVSLNIESIPLKSGEESPPLQLGKKGETVTYHISVKAVNHIRSTYLLSATREGGHKRSIGIIILIVVAVIVAVLLCLLLGYAAYVYACAGRMLELRDFQIFNRRENLYSRLPSRSS